MKSRLKKDSDFDRVFKKGKRIYGKTLSINYLPSDELKVGFSVGKRHGNAVKRNRIKRLLRASFYQTIKGRENLKFYMVVIPKVRDGYFFNEYKEDFVSLLDNLK